MPEASDGNVYINAKHLLEPLVGRITAHFGHHIIPIKKFSIIKDNSCSDPICKNLNTYLGEPIEGRIPFSFTLSSLSSAIISDGRYHLKLTDEAGNKKIKHLIISTTPPTIG